MNILLINQGEVLEKREGARDEAPSAMPEDLQRALLLGERLQALGHDMASIGTSTHLSSKVLAVALGATGIHPDNYLDELYFKIIGPGERKRDMIRGFVMDDARRAGERALRHVVESPEGVFVSHGFKIASMTAVCRLAHGLDIGGGDLFPEPQEVRQLDPDSMAISRLQI